MADITRDELDAITVVTHSFMLADAKDFDGYRRLYADQVTVDFGGVNPDAEGLIDSDRMRESAEALVGPVALTQHMITNQIATVDGDEATVVFYEQALHVHPALGTDPAVNSWTIFGRGEHRVRRTDDGWKIIGARLIPLHSTGNANLLADVAASLA